MNTSLDQSTPDPRRALPEYGTLTPADYEAMGLKVGLEIHQQLLTRRKLFCRCPAGRYSTEHHAEILRHMRPTLSEMGEYDGTALMEFKTRKEIIYLINNETVCTYEMDDAPPFEIDDEALDEAIAITMMLGCKVVGEIHITRKQYLDGSIPTGFQRTTIVGVDGRVPFRGRDIHIRQLGLEEDSCREVSDRGHRRVYRSDRLGMPLIETVTGPDMRTPEEAAAVGQLLRHLVRASGLVRTGSGAGRQDVNVSVTGGTRVEIKGVSNLRAVPRLVHSEALRQRSLLGIADLLRERGVTADGIGDRWHDVTAVVESTGCNFIRGAVNGGATVGAVALPGFEGLLDIPTQPHTTFLKEFSDRVRVIACLSDLPNLVSSTQVGLSLSSVEWDKIVRICGVEAATPILVVWGGADDVATACREIALRARDAVEGVPSETRQALDDGTNGFERILPGADRMYPDTDLPPLRLAEERVDLIEAALPQTPWQREATAVESGVGADLAERLGRHPAWRLFAHLVRRLPADSKFTAQQLASILLDRSCPRPPSLGAAGPWWERTVDRLVEGEILPEAVWLSSDEITPVADAAQARRDFDARLATLPDGGPETIEQREDWIMGYVMATLAGKVAGATVYEWVREVTA